MTEKRFIFCNKTTDSNVWDTFEKQCYGWEYVVSLLNSFDDTIKDLSDENDQLKISSTMYHNLFKELQRQMQGVKSIYDLDSKDFEDLIELSKGNVFDDEIGWVHLPIEELQE